MGLKILPYKGGYRPNWYGVYRDNGKLTTENLGIRIQGTPPASGLISDRGDEAFERSRAKAQKKLDDLLANRKEKGEAIRETQKTIEIKTGRKFKDPALDDLSALYLQRLGDRSPCHIAMIRSAFAKFAAFARHPGKNLKPAHTLLSVTPELAIAFFQSIRDNYAWETLKKFSIVLSGAFTRFAPFGVANPFEGARINAVGRKTADDEKTVHHRPLDRTELRKVWAEAKKDSDKMIYNLAVTSASTGLRIGDCCCLKWADIDLKGGFITTTAAKTGALLTVPIFDYDPASANYEPDLGEFRRILETSLAESEKDEEYVFPSAATAYLREEVETVNGQKKITYPGRSLIYQRGKILFAKALFTDEAKIADADIASPDDNRPTPSSADILAAIQGTRWTSERKARVTDIYTRYSQGETYNVIQAETNYSRSTISYDLGAVEKLVGIKLKPSSKRPSNPTVRDLLKFTRQERTTGGRAGTIYSWHSLRASFVVLALDNGVPLNVVRELVGHTTCDMTLEYYHPTRRIAAENARRILANRNRNTHSQPQLLLDDLKSRLTTLSDAERAELKKLL